MELFDPFDTLARAADAAAAPTDPVGDPLAALADGGVIAVVTGVEGPHYRAPGAFMAFPAAGGAVGQLSSGCIEADLALHAADVAATGRAVRLRYGRGSPFVDLTLPCGGGLDVALVPVRDPAPVTGALARLAARRPAVLRLSETGLADTGLADAGLGLGGAGAGFAIHLAPPVQCLTAGTGVEALVFAALAAAAGHPVRLATPDAATARAAAARGVPVTMLTPGATGLGADPDPWTAVVLFFHDHDREPPLLADALRSPAFYVGAQGSLRTHRARVAALRDMGLPDVALARLRGPIGLIPSARDPQVLAVSVLAEILAEAPR
ncbi:XdhC family protein [Paracoccus luteus]|uniref:XdhC family protein n=1 Tax=Paracoccus luteus TaxID=2508543 RepID=UPI00107020A2|nr:XdhC family protein [Paracoccus luteus]